MNFFRRLNTSRRQSDTSACSSGRSNDEFGLLTPTHFLCSTEGVEHKPKFGEGSASGRRARTMSLGSIFSRSRPKHFATENYTTDFWVRNFSENRTVSWNDFRAAFVLDYKNGLVEFSHTGHLSCVLTAAHDELCNKESVVSIGRYRTFIGADPSPNAIWNKIKGEATKRVFDEAVRDSLCL